MPRKPKQLTFKGVSGWGGIRRGAGRKNLTGLVSHGKRPQVDFKKPLHLTIRLAVKKVNLRCGKVLRLFEQCARKAKDFGLHIVHFSIQGNHIHIIAEAKDNDSLMRGMRSLGSRLGKNIRKLIGGVGPVFAGRFHLEVIGTPTQMKHALLYVLQNWAKHRDAIEHFDEYSSAYWFNGWRKLMGRKFTWLLEKSLPQQEPPDYLSKPRSWLAREGWMRATGCRATDLQRA